MESDTKRQCPDCYAWEEHALEGTVYTCCECDNEWDINVPTTDAPDEESEDFRRVLLFNEFGECTDGCVAYEVDGRCPHGYPAWTSALGYA